MAPPIPLISGFTALISIGLITILAFSFYNIVQARDTIDELNNKLFPFDSCSNCPSTCATAPDCPSLTIINTFNSTVECVIGACVYSLMPLISIPIQIGRAMDKYCQDTVLISQQFCIKMESVGDSCTNFFAGCQGTFPCQFG